MSKEEIKTIEANGIEIPVEYLNQTNVIVQGKKYLQLQQENQQLKEALEMKSYCKYANKCNKMYDCSKEEYNNMCEVNMKLDNENNDLKEQLQQRDEVIEEAIRLVKEKGCYDEVNDEWCTDIDWYIMTELLETLIKYKGDNNE